VAENIVACLIALVGCVQQRQNGSLCITLPPFLPNYENETRLKNLARDTALNEWFCLSYFLTFT
jgi:hypothetical protein